MWWRCKHKCIFIFLDFSCQFWLRNSRNLKKKKEKLVVFHPENPAFRSEILLYSMSWSWRCKWWFIIINIITEAPYLLQSFNTDASIQTAQSTFYKVHSPASNRCICKDLIITSILPVIRLGEFSIRAFEALTLIVSQLKKSTPLLLLPHCYSAVSRR